jgi:hypothetical protein
VRKKFSSLGVGLFIRQVTVRKLTISADDVDESALLSISEIGGPKLESFGLHSGVMSEFKGKFWGKFLAESPMLRELDITVTPRIVRSALKFRKM